MRNIYSHFITAVALVLSVPAFAFQAESPVDIVSDHLQYSQNKQKALFTGNVKVKHGKLALGSDALEITYNNAAGVENIVANGHVTVVDGKNTATSNTAIYHPDTGMVTMKGNVKMLREGNVLTGEELYYDPEKGTMKLANEAEKGRVRATFSLDKAQKTEE